MNPYKAGCLLLLLLLAVLILLKGCEKKEVLTITVNKTDTIEVEKIKLVEVIKVTPPKTIYIQKEPDTTARKQAEARTIILGVKVGHNRLNVQSIDSLGIIKDAEFSLMPDLSIRIGGEGEVELEFDPETEKARVKAERRKQRVKFARRTLTVLTFVAGIFIGGKL